MNLKKCISIVRNTLAREGRDIVVHDGRMYLFNKSGNGFLEETTFQKPVEIAIDSLVKDVKALTGMDPSDDLNYFMYSTIWQENYLKLPAVKNGTFDLKEIEESRRIALKTIEQIMELYEAESIPTSVAIACINGQKDSVTDMLCSVYLHVKSMIDKYTDTVLVQDIFYNEDASDAEKIICLKYKGDIKKEIEDLINSEHMLWNKIPIVIKLKQS